VSLLSTDRVVNLKTLPDTEGHVWLSLDKYGLYCSTDSGKHFEKVTKIQTIYTFAFGRRG